MSRRFLIATAFVIVTIIGGFMSAGGTTLLNGALMICGMAGAITTLFALNNRWGNSKVFSFNGDYNDDYSKE